MVNKIYRSAIDGRFISEEKAKRTNPNTWVKETIKPAPKPPTKKK